jgi:ABC-type antimicrobial peptide transport system permease subunit
VRDIFALAWQALCRHKLRGLLAVGGVAVGITAITGIISAEIAWSKALDETFAQLGVTKIAVDPPDADAEAMRRQLTLDDAAAIREMCPLAGSVMPISWAELGLKVGRDVTTAVVKAGPVGVEDAHGIDLLEGRPLEQADVDSRSPVCLVGVHLADTLFGSSEHLGRILRVGGRGFTVVGVFGDRSGDHGYRQAMVGRRADIYIPITTAQRIPQLNSVHKIIVEAEDQAGAARQIDALLRDRLRARPGAEFVTSALTMKQAALRSRRRVSLFVALAGFLALLVAGIGVANLLFVSVAERAREIGLRRACGATPWGIAGQFLAESVVLCLAGAAAGVAAAFALTQGFFSVAFPDVIGPRNPISSTGPEQMATLQLPSAEPAVAWSALLIAALVSALTGLLAGIQPAAAAAQLPPAEAIRASAVPRHQARSALTILQVALGVAAVLLLVSLYEGRAHTELASLREGEGADVVGLQFADDTPGQVLNNSLSAIHAGLSEIVKMLKEPDQFRVLLDDLTYLSYFDPRMQTRASVRAGARALRVEGDLPVICGSVPGAFETDAARAREADLLPDGAGPIMAEGEFFADRDLDEARRVCVLPHSAKADLFGPGSAIGETVVIAGRPFEVCGVFAPWVEQAASTFPRWVSAEQFPVCVPATTFAREIHDYPDMMDYIRDGWTHAWLRVEDVMAGQAALDQLQAVLVPRIRLPKNVVLYPRGSLVSAVDIARRQRWAELRAGMGGAAALLIAIVGLVNMLLVSVHESIREVGLRRALGALRTQIGWQFLREGAALAAAGALLGLLLVMLIMPWLAKIVDIPARIPIHWAVLSAMGAVLAGCLASLGPALHAARIEPVEALRYE